MTIKTRILGAILTIGILPLVITGIISYVLTSQDVSEALQKEAGQRLTAMREEKREAIRIYVDDLEKLMHTLGRSTTFKNAAEMLSADFDRSLRREIQFERTQESVALPGLYDQGFGSQFRKMNPNMASDTPQGFYKQLDEAARYYQSRYIADNPNPIGEKDKLMSATETGAKRIGYDVMHERFHAELQKTQQEYDLYDLFLINPEGRVVYSVYKELDFATSLETGPFSRSGLAEAWRTSRSAEPESVNITDFAPYAPSYNAPASFMSTPIYVEGQSIGTLVIQLPVQLFTDILTSQQRWEEVGMGKTGEVFLVGPDRTLRTNSRKFLENSQDFTDRLVKSGHITRESATDIINRMTSVGIVSVDEAGIDAALAGETGIIETQSYLGVKSMISYSPIKIGGMRWAAIAQIDYDEAYEGLYTVQQSLLILTAILTLGMAIVALIFGLFITTRLTTPIRQLVDAMRDVAEGEGDLTVQLKTASRKDEIGDLSKAFNTFVNKVRGVVSDVTISATQLSGVSHEFAKATEEGRIQISRQRDMAQSIASAVTEFAASIDEVARSSNETLDTMTQANDLSQHGSVLALKARDEIEQLSQGTRDSSDAISALSSEIDQIKEVLDVINDIAEQTSLLALNAAIEAARAGEQGRGFAVVADEVRQLSSRTQDATVNIARKIESLRTSADETVVRVQRSLESANTGIDLSNQTNDGLHEISTLVSEVNGMQSQVASAVTEQQAVVKDIETSILDIDHLSEISFNESSRTQDRAKELLDMADSLQRLVGRFKV